MSLFRGLIKLINFLIIIAVLLIGAGAGLIWLPTDSSIVTPAVKYVGENMLLPLKLDVDNINGSVWNGYSLNNLKIISGDEIYLTLDHAAVSPDWDLILSDTFAKKPVSLSWIKLFELEGLSADAPGLMKIAEHFSGGEDKDDNSNFNIEIQPIKISVKDVNINNIQAVIADNNNLFNNKNLNFNLENFDLNESGDIDLKSALVLNENKNKNILPVDLSANLNFQDEILNSKFKIGTGAGSLKGHVMPPFDLRADLTAFNIDDFMPFIKPFINNNAVDVKGRLDGRVFVKSINNNKIAASGVLSMPRGAISVINSGRAENIPLSFRIPWEFNENIFSVKDLNLKTKAASFALNSDVDLNKNSVNANGSAKNISLREIGRMAAPDAKLLGEGGSLNFDVFINNFNNLDLNNIKANIDAKIPDFSAMNKKLAKNFSANINLRPNSAPEIKCDGEIFGGNLSAKGELAQAKNGDIKPEAIINLANLDLAALAAAFPEIAQIKPSGRVNLNTRVHSDFSVDGDLTSNKVAAKISGSNLSLNNLAANFNYNFNQNRAVLNSFRTNFGKALLNASGTADIKNKNLDFKASVRNFDPKSIPQINNQVQGTFDADAIIKGAFNNPAVALKLNGKNIKAADIALGNLNTALNYANNQLNISDTRLNIPGGSVNLKGNVNLKNASNPRLDVAADTAGINLAQLSKSLKLKEPVTGNVKGGVKINGALKNLSAAVNLQADNIKTGDLKIPYAVIDAGGDAGQIKVKKLEANINEAKINGHGGVKINYKNFLESALSIALNVNGLELRPLLTRLMGSSPVGGILYGRLNFTGTLTDPVLFANITSPLTASQTLIDLVSLKLNSPAKDKYKINAVAKVADFTLDLDGNLNRKGDIWLYDINSKPLDINKLIAAKAPGLKDLTSGNAFIKINGSFGGKNAALPVNILATVPSLKALDGKINVKNISLPFKFISNSNKVTLKNGHAELSGGVITSNLDINLADSTWTGNASVKKLDFGKLAAPFLPEGELIGTVDANMGMKGNLGVLSTSFASGKFSTSSGYLHKMAILDKITPTKRVSFENIRGTFSWDGRDLFLNPGTQATADANEPLYRYFAVNGSMGIPGKGLRLMCDGRFDLKILDRILGAMKGAFQYVTGSLSGNGTGFLKDAAGRVIGVKKRDFQNVSFTIANSWNELQLLDLKITKPIQDFLPIDKLNDEEGKQRVSEEKQFKLNLKIPVGQGGANPEDNSTEDQLKEQLIDNLFNF